MDDVSVHSITKGTVYVDGFIYSAVILIWHFGKVFNLPNWMYMVYTASMVCFPYSTQTINLKYRQ